MNVDLPARGSCSAMELLTLILIFLVIYVPSLYLNPWVDCTRCKGKPKLKGWIFNDAKHICGKCGGTGLQMRFWRRFLPGKPRGT